MHFGKVIGTIYRKCSDMLFCTQQLLHSGPMLPRGRPATKTTPQHHTLPLHMPRIQSHLLSPLSQHGFCPMQDERVPGQASPQCFCCRSGLPERIGGKSSQGWLELSPHPGPSGNPIVIFVFVGRI